jgi:DNA-binding transcriptional LysR family regulator
MQQPADWDDFRYLVAVKRGQTLRAAARQLRVDDTTVSRRLASLERKLGKRLVQRQGDSRLALTDAGERVAHAAEAMEKHYESIAALVDDGDACRGTVRLTTVPILANRLFARNYCQLASRHPGLVVEIVPDGRNFDLGRREADIAVRLGRPTVGGLTIKAQRVGSLFYAAYAARDTSYGQARPLPWITYEDSMSNLPHARWMERTGQGAPEGRASLRVHDAETALESAAAGLGKTLLPKAVADSDKRLRKIDVPVDQPIPMRDIWLLTHADQTPGVAAVTRWIEDIVAASCR